MITQYSDNHTCRAQWDGSVCYLIRVIAMLVFISAFGYQGLLAKTLRVGVYQNPPKLFYDEESNPAGIFVEIMDLMAKNEGWDIEYIKVSWDEGLAMLEKEELDLMPDVARNFERDQKFGFHSVTALSSWSQLYARNGKSIRSILDLNGKRIAVLEGSIQQKDIIRLSEGYGVVVELFPLQNFNQVFMAVREGAADAAAVNCYFGDYESRRIGLNPTSVVFSPSALYFAAPKNKNQDVLARIDANLERLKSQPNSEYYRILKRWTAESVKYRIPRGFIIGAIILSSAFMVSLIFSILLKKQIALRTQELEIANQEMNLRIRLRTAELEDAMHKAQAADKTKSSFLATMSHELRTPLNSIIGFTGIILQGLAGPLTDEQNKQMQMVQNSARHLLSLINDVLDISKIEAGQFDLSKHSFDLEQSIGDMLKLVSPMAEKKKLGLSRDIRLTHKTILGDQRRLEQVILNLLSNAVKFTELGSICIAAREENEGIVITVTDTGIGISEESQALLFQPFSQLDSGLTRKYEGTGLGLAISKKIICMMGGEITVDSKLGQGSVFRVWIPTKKELEHG